MLYCKASQTWIYLRFVKLYKYFNLMSMMQKKGNEYYL